MSIVFGVEEGEGTAVALMVALYFVISVSFVLVQTTAFGLFIEEFGAHSLPYAYLSVAVLSSLIAYLYLKLSQRLSLSASLFVNLSFLTAVCLAFWAGLRSGIAHWFIFFLPFWFQTLVGLANLVVWHTAGHLFNVRQAKRLFGLVGAGNWIANILGGLLMAAILSVAGTADLYFLAAVALAASAFVLRAVLVIPAAPVPTASPTPTAGPRQETRSSPFRQPYSRLIFGYTLLWWIAFCFIDNIFFERAGMQVSSGAALASFLGRQLSVSGVIAIITTSFVTSRVVARYGLRLGLLVMPVIAAASILLLALGGTLGWPSETLFWVATAAKTLNVALGFSISQALSTLLYQPLLGQQRSATQTIAEGIIQPVAIGLAGLILLGLSTGLHLDAIGLSYVFLAVAALWFWTIFRVSREYPLVMSEALQRRSLGESMTLVFDPSAMEQLRRGLNHPRAGRALYALNQLEQLAPRAWPTMLLDALPDLLAHPAPEVRREVLRRLFVLRAAAAIPLVRARLATEQVPAVRAMLVQVLAAAGRKESEEHVLASLSSPDLEIRQGAIVGLLASGNPHASTRASESLSRLVESAQVEDRLLAARIGGECSLPGVRQVLPRLLLDEAAVVRHAAIRAAGCHDDQEMVELVLAASDRPDAAHVAEKVLVSNGRQALAVIAAQLDRATNPSIPRRRLHTMIRVLGRIRAPESIRLLSARIGTPDSQLRYQVLLSLSRLGFRSQSPDEILEQVSSEVTLAAWLAVAIRTLESLDASRNVGVLTGALEGSFSETRGRILLLLSFIYDAQAMLRAYSALRKTSAERAPLALETVDAMLPPRAKPLVLPLIEGLSHDSRIRRWGAGGIAVPSLTLENLHKDLIQGRPAMLCSPWTRLCAIHVAAILEQRSCEGAIEALTSDSDPEVREASRWSLSRLRPDSSVKGAEPMLSLVEKVLILKSAPLFGETPDNVLAEIAALVEELSLEKDQVIFHKGERGDSLYIVVSGSVKVWDDGRLLNELGEGEVFGELALLDPEPRLATVKAAEFTRLLRLNEPQFREVLDAQPEVSAAIIRVITRYLRSQLQYARDVSGKLRAMESFGFLNPTAAD